MGTTSDKLTYLNDTKTQIRDGINALGGSLDSDDTFRSYVDELDNLWEELPHTTGTGTSLSLATKSGKMKVNLLGNTSQTGTPTPSSPIPVNVVSGDNEVVVKNKNLYQNSNPIPKAANGNVSTTTTEYIDSNSFKINLKKTTTDNNSMFCQIPLDVNDFKPSTTYTLSKTNTIVGTQFNGAGALRTYINGNYGTTTYSDSITFTTPSTLSSFAVLFYGCHSSTQQGEATITINEIQLEENNTQTAFEPYQSSTYPIHLPVENLLNPVGTTTELNGMKLTNNGDGTFTIDGTASANTGIPLTNLVSYPITLKANQPYTQSAEIISGDLGDCTIVPAFKNSSDITTYNYFYCNKIKLTDTKTSTDTMTATNYNLYIASGGTATNCTFRVQLERGSKANSYTPYGTTPIELCKIGNYQDYIYKDNKKWYKYEAIGKAIIDENIVGGALADSNRRIMFSSSGNSFLSNVYIPTPSSVFNLTPSLSNYFSSSTQSEVTPTNNKVGFSKWGDTIFAYFSAIYNSVESFKTWLSSNNVTIYYALATPTTTEITGTLKDELEAVWRANSYKGTTNISQVNNDLPFELDVEGLSA